MRKTFFETLYKEMKKDKNVYALTGDLGYGGFDKIRDEMPDRFINCGAAEQSMLDIAVGLAQEGKKPFVYSITPFLIFRPFETLRTYINHESIPVRLVGSGRDTDYEHDGFSHNAEDVKQFLNHLSNIKQYWPDTKESVKNITEAMVKENRPAFISLSRII